MLVRRHGVHAHGVVRDVRFGVLEQREMLLHDATQPAEVGVAQAAVDLQRVAHDVAAAVVVVADVEGHLQLVVVFLGGRFFVGDGGAGDARRAVALRQRGEAVEVALALAQVPDVNGDVLRM